MGYWDKLYLLVSFVSFASSLRKGKGLCFFSVDLAVFVYFQRSLLLSDICIIDYVKEKVDPPAPRRLCYFDGVAKN